MNKSRYGSKYCEWLGNRIRDGQVITILAKRGQFFLLEQQTKGKSLYCVWDVLGRALILDEPNYDKAFEIFVKAS